MDKNLPDDIMLSSAEDLNNDGSFMDKRENYPNSDPLVQQKVEEKPTEIAPEREAEPEIVMPPREPKEKPVAQKAPEPKSRIVTAESYHGVNKGALIWMIILTIILGGVVGIMFYAFITNHLTSSAEPEPDTSVQDNMNTVAGALEVYLTNVNLDNYNTNIVLVNGGGVVSLSGTLKHTVFINSSSAMTLILNGVTIESPDNAAIANLSKNDLILRLDGMNTLTSAGGKYAAALYSNGAMTIKGDGQVMIYSSAAGSKGIASENGYQINGGSVVALSQSVVERPKDESSQAYFVKELPQLYREGTVVRAVDEGDKEVVKFTALGDFSSIFVSNSKLEDGVQYSISLGGSGGSQQ